MTSGQYEMTAHDGNRIDELSNETWTMTIRVGDKDQEVQAPFHGEWIGN